MLSFVPTACQCILKHFLLQSRKNFLFCLFFSYIENNNNPLSCLLEILARELKLKPLAA